MDRANFVDAVRIAVQDGAVTSTISALSRPPGRKPRADLVALATWFNQLAFEDRQNVERVVAMTADAATFSFLCVLDGVAAIEDGPDKGTLDLRYRRGDEDVSLTDRGGDVLHELF